MRGLIALRDTRTPLMTNAAQLLLRALAMAALIGALGVRAVPVAFAGAAWLEATVLAAILLRRVRARSRTMPGAVALAARSVAQERLLVEQASARRSALAG